MPHIALGHSLVAQDNPLDACSKEDNGADICQVVKESQEDAESCLPSQWGAGTLSQPSEAPEQISPAERAHPPSAPQPRLRQALKDTDRRGGGNGQDGARGDGLLGIPQVSRAVGASHDAWGKREWCQGEQSYSPYPSQITLMPGTV